MAAITTTVGAFAAARPVIAPVRSTVASARRAAIPSNVVSKRLVRTAAYNQDDSSVDVEAIVKDLQTKWDGVENKSQVVAYAGGALVLLWLSSTLVSAVNAVPLVPKLLELVGLGYTSWFTYRYLLFKSSREELFKDVDELKRRVSGVASDTKKSAQQKL